MLYTSQFVNLYLISVMQYLYVIWVQDQTHFERGIAGDSIEVVKKHPVLDQVISYLDTYFDGCAQDLSSLPLAPIGTDFEKRVWAYLQAIPYGQTVTYGQIAQDLQVNSAQAIGGAVGRNPWSILVPCHRVLGAGNRLTGNASGVEKKAWLMQPEGAVFQKNKE